MSVDSAQAAQLGETLERIQSQYGQKPDKPREVKKTLGKDDFLRIMITQMKNQDPTNPFKAEQMATEIAQFTSVEQLHNVNQNLNKMASQNKPLEHLAMTNLIGKVVTIDRERFPHAEGEKESLSYKLPKDAASVRIAVISEMGEVVLEKELGPQKMGENSFSWDGTKMNTLPAKTGRYVYRVEAKDDRGFAVPINPKVRSRVIGVSFEGNEPVFLVGDAKHQDKITLQNIAMIEVDDSEKQSGAQQVAGGPSLLGNFPLPVTEKPATSVTSPSLAQPAPASVPTARSTVFEVARPNSNPIINSMSNSGNPSAPKAPNLSPMGMPEERGFPNGLADPDEKRGGGVYGK